MRINMKQEYAVYQGDEFQFIDTLENICDRLDISPATARNYSFKSYWYQKHQGRGRLLVRV